MAVHSQTLRLDEDLSADTSQRTAMSGQSDWAMKSGWDGRGCLRLHSWRSSTSKLTYLNIIISELFINLIMSRVLPVVVLIAELSKGIIRRQ